jgi:hypothetical protein
MTIASAVMIASDVFIRLCLAPVWFVLKRKCTHTRRDCHHR